MSIEVTTTSRGFAVGRFLDRYRQRCSIQESSLAEEACIWLGCDEGEGRRAHLTQEMAAALIPLLQRFVATGRLSEPVEEGARGSEGQGSPMEPQDIARLAAAVAEFERRLPGWWWSIGSCSISRDASCGPDRTGPDADLLIHREMDEGIHHDGEGDVADSLRLVMEHALARRAALKGSAEAPACVP